MSTVTYAPTPVLDRRTHIAELSVTHLFVTRVTSSCLVTGKPFGTAGRPGCVGWQPDATGSRRVRDDCSP